MTYSSFGRRLGAYLIDFLLLSPLFALPDEDRRALGRLHPSFVGED